MALLFAVGTVAAGDATAPAQAVPPLSYGVSDVLQLSQAQVSDGTIVTYIRTSGNSYGLDAGQIVYLRQQGVSDTVITAMLTQPKAGTTGYAAGNYPPPPPPPQPMVDATPPPPVDTTPSSTVYVIPDTATANYCANYYNYNPGGAWSFYASPVVYIGGGGYGGGWHGGGGWHASGGWHSSGGWHH